jgi:hypothetical protein
VAQPGDLLRGNVALKTYWTRVFSSEDPEPMMRQNGLKPGVYCLNDDKELNERLYADAVDVDI